MNITHLTAKPLTQQPKKRNTHTETKPPLTQQTLTQQPHTTQNNTLHRTRKTQVPTTVKRLTTETTPKPTRQQPRRACKQLQERTIERLRLREDKDRPEREDRSSRTRTSRSSLDNPRGKGDNRDKRVKERESIAGTKPDETAKLTGQGDRVTRARAKGTK